MVYYHSSWYTIIRHGVLSFIMVCNHSSWSTIIRHGVQSFVMVYNHSSWSTIIHHGSDHLHIITLITDTPKTIVHAFPIVLFSILSDYHRDTLDYVSGKYVKLYVYPYMQKS